MDFLIHAIAFSDKNELTGRFINTSRGELPELAGDLLLLLHRRGPPRGRADAGWRHR